MTEAIVFHTEPAGGVVIDVTCAEAPPAAVTANTIAPKTRVKNILIFSPPMLNSLLRKRFFLPVTALLGKHAFHIASGPAKR
ncbi:MULTISPECIES: hypothetical protein [Rhodobacterales]|uniref:hypothetical protein n=1 Tax=Rhodobacterales TaxID=204455 RepID=UPI001B885534|nr:MULTISPECIES: hypothetical protein [Rhodobacterales]